MTGKLVLGLGCRKGESADVLRQLVKSTLAKGEVSDSALSVVATLDGKQLEPAIAMLSRSLGLTVVTFSAARLEEETPRLANPSDVVFRETGCHGVAEAAALAAAGEGAWLLVEKQVLDGCTAAIAMRA